MAATTVSVGASWVELTPADVTEFSIQNVGRPDGMLKWATSLPAPGDTGYLVVRGDVGSHSNMSGSGKVYGRLAGTRRGTDTLFELG